MKDSPRVILFAVLSLFLVGLASANGLNLEENSMQINKTSGVDKYFNATILNQETFKFYNITPVGGIISFDKFNLESGGSKTVQIKIETDSDFNGEIKIVGSYYAELGYSNETEVVTVGLDGVDICDLDLIQGDTITWRNTLGGSIKIRNLQSGEYLSTIIGGSEYSNKFETAMEFDYQVYKTGLPFSQVCHINIRPTEGFVHSSIYDAILTLDIDINYEPTTISTTFLTDSYTVNYNGEATDIFKITNTGNRIAKNIILSGEWFSFGANDFDLGVGQSKNVGYTIRPFIYETNQTNKTYQRTLKIEGNFEKVEKELFVTVNYKDLGGTGGNSSYNREAGKNWVLLHCILFPEDCPERLIYMDGSGGNVTFVINEETYKEKILADDAFQEEIRRTLKLQNEKLSTIENETKESLNNSKENSEELKEFSTQNENLLSGIQLGVIILLSALLFLGIFAIVFKQKGFLKLKKLFHDKELPS